jgi:hypothetical protein
MALVKCSECSNDISTDAKKCPQCGANNKEYKSIIGGIFKLFFFLILVVYLATFLGERKKKAEKAEQEKIAIENVQAPPLSETEIKKILKPFRKSVDKIEGVSWYEMPYYHQMYKSRIQPYIGESNGSFWLRLKIVYHADNWLFIQGFKFVGDGNIRELSMHGRRIERDNSSTIWEWVDVKADSEEINLLRLIGTSKDAEIRYIGRTYYKDRKITTNEKKAIKFTVESYLKLVRQF